MENACQRLEKRFIDSGGQGLTEDAVARAHLQGCESCRATYGALEEVDTMLSTTSLEISPDVVEPAASPRAEVSWYVTLGAEPAGPMDQAEIERLWSSLEINEDSLAWRPGMDDWAAIADLPALLYLTFERSQRLTGEVGGAVSAWKPTPALVATINWSPSAAVDLIDLVTQELETAAAVPAPQGPRLAKPIAGLPGFAGVELFAASEPYHYPTYTTSSSSLADPFPMESAGLGTGAVAWGLPELGPAPKKWPLWLAISAGGALAVFILALALGLRMQTNTQEKATGSTAPSEKTTPPRDQHGSNTSGPPAEHRGINASLAKKGTAPAQPATHLPPPADPPRVRERQEKRVRRSPAKVQANRPRTPARRSIVQVVKENAKVLAPCMQASRRKGELVPGRYTLVLQWRIKPDGRVTSARMMGPEHLMDTSLPSCLPQKMRQWRFPRSRQGVPIKRFPFGPFNLN